MGPSLKSSARLVLVSLPLASLAFAASAPDLPGQLFAQEAETRVLALKELARLGPAGAQFAPHLLCSIEMEADRFNPRHPLEWSITQNAVQAATAIGPEIIPLAIAALKQDPTAPPPRFYDGTPCAHPPAPLVREDRLDFLREMLPESIGRIGREAVGPLLAAFRENGSHRVAMAAGLRGAGPTAAEAVPDLAAALSDDWEVLRTTAVLALGAIGPASSAAVKDLVQQLETNTDNSVASRVFRGFILDTLGRIGPAAIAAIPAIARAEADGDPQIRAEAQKARRRIEGASEE